MLSTGRKSIMSEYDPHDPSVDTHDGDYGDDGIPPGSDTVTADFDGHGTVTLVDTDHDHYANSALVDADGDGHYDAIYTDEYGNTDGVLDTVAVDTNHDGVVD